ncbi:MAG TPA: hypothetical protein ENN80_08365, partial [Candidatus Hydrogenedentes bacterium]|nr:hypothetical protein [Candidatus Hydrogenedentota bacterium]
MYLVDMTFESSLETARTGVDFSALGGPGAFWETWGFGPWAQGAMVGVARRATIRKDALLGEVARYYADDYIVWT